MADEKPHWLGHRDRLRTKLIRRGATSLDDYELLETLLFAFLPRRDVKPIAKDLLKRFGSISAVFAAPVDQISSVKGMGQNSAAYLKASAELSSRAARETLSEGISISSWTTLLDYVKAEIQHEAREQFRVLFLDRKNQLLCDEIMGLGTVDHAPVYPREIARRALELSSSAVILVHNHPSGDPTPSRADIEMTSEVISALKTLEIIVHDHLIIGRQGVTSFRSRGLI